MLMIPLPVIVNYASNIACSVHPQTNTCEIAEARCIPICIQNSSTDHSIACASAPLLGPF